MVSRGVGRTLRGTTTVYVGVAATMAETPTVDVGGGLAAVVVHGWNYNESGGNNSEEGSNNFLLIRRAVKGR